MAWPKGKPRKPQPEAATTEALRFKAIGGRFLLQQAWAHPAGIEWRNVETVPAEAPDWEDRHAEAAPPV